MCVVEFVLLPCAISFGSINTWACFRPTLSKSLIYGSMVVFEESSTDVGGPDTREFRNGDSVSVF